MVLLALLLPPVTLELDRSVPLAWLERLPFVAFNQAQGARALLSTVAGSVVTVAGVTFSITMVVLSLATSQFGPRLLRNFVRDAFNQLVLGTFLATFVYCLLILRTIQAAQEGTEAFVPHLSITVAVLLTLVDLILFIGFINRTAESIQVGTVLARIDGALGRRLRAEPPKRDQPSQAAGLPADFSTDARPLLASRGGYLQTIDEVGLLALAGDRDLIIRTVALPGSFVPAGAPLAEVYPGTALHRFADRLRDRFALGAHRTTTQDLGFHFDQLLEVAVRAMSPGVNDPFTAIMCSDRIADNLLLLSRRPTSRGIRFDAEGRLRLILDVLDGADLARRMFATLRQHARTDPMVLEHLLLRLESLGRSCEHGAMRRALSQQVELLLLSARDALDAASLPIVERAGERAQRAFDDGGDGARRG
jgi:uncharacterized membrane protein